MELFTLVLGSLVFLETTALCVSNFSGKAKNLNRKARRRIFVDTSTLIDGRILSVARAGFIGDELLIPRSVIRELQLLADGADAEKRARARFGLDVVNDLERLENAEVRVFADAAGSRIKVDERLLELAKENHGIILTNDFNLAKVAATEHIYAININELAQGLRSEYLPGDHLSVRVIGAGSNPKQGIAYLADGTMVVVDDGEKYAGKSFPIEIEFVRYLQTNAGKMMFAKVVEVKTQPIKHKQILPHPKLKNAKTTPVGTKRIAKKVEDKKPEQQEKTSAKKRSRKNRESRAEDSLINLANK